MKTLNHFKVKNNEVGVYFPSQNWSKFSQFAVMDGESQELIATVGYFHDMSSTQEEPEKEDVLHFKECLEQANLYAKAPLMFELLSKIILDPDNDELLEEADKLLSKITDISEPFNRIVGAEFA